LFGIQGLENRSTTKIAFRDVEGFMRVIHTGINRFRIEDDGWSFEGSYNKAVERAADIGITPEEFSDAVNDMVSRGNNVAMFGLRIAPAFEGRAEYGFMYTMKEAA
jgi:hypothetical protein